MACIPLDTCASWSVTASCLRYLRRNTSHPGDSLWVHTFSQRSGGHRHLPCGVGGTVVSIAGRLLSGLPEFNHGHCRMPKKKSLTSTGPLPPWQGGELYGNERQSEASGVLGSGNRTSTCWTYRLFCPHFTRFLFYVAEFARGVTPGGNICTVIVFKHTFFKYFEMRRTTDMPSFPLLDRLFRS